MIYRAHTVIPLDSPAITNGAILVRGERIGQIGSFDELKKEHPEEAVTEFGRVVLMPGLVNLHSHLELEALNDLAEPTSFLSWLERLVVRSQEMTGEDWLVSARRGVERSLAGGMTATADISRWGAGAVAMAEANLRGISFHEMVAVDLAGFSKAREDLIKRLGSAAEKPWRRAGISPHAPYSLSGGSIKKLIVMASDMGLPTAIHVAETADELSMIKDGSGALSAIFNSLIKTEIPRKGTGLSPVAYLDSLGALSSSTLAIHCVHLEPSDLYIIKKRGSAVVCCPTSNALLKTGEAPVALLLGNDVTFGLGTDSAASNPRMDIFDEMRAVRDEVARQSEGTLTVTSAELLRMATVRSEERR
ncbi:MAG: amidohydrolase family protein, partial [Actinobacteria bacterium]|nr:amidohydrolase family protein [Actinomycetota bacterium]